MTDPGDLAAIGLGSNLGDRSRTLAGALDRLAEADGVTLLAASPLLPTDPVGGPAGQGAFLNAAALVRFTGPPHDLLRLLQTIEADAGRVRRERWGERTLDLDLLLMGLARLRTPDLTLPHPLMAVRRFVLAPLAAIGPGLVHPPTGRTVADLLANLDRRPTRVAIVDRDDARQSRIVDRLRVLLEDAEVVAGPDPRAKFAVAVGEPAQIEDVDPVPRVEVDPGPADAIADHIADHVAAIAGGTRGA